jgi:hypothetical protein
MRFFKIFDIYIHLNIVIDICIRIQIYYGSKVDISEFDFYYFSLSNSTSVFDNIRYYLYPFSVKLFKKLYLFSVTNIINFIINL